MQKSGLIDATPSASEQMTEPNKTRVQSMLTDHLLEGYSRVEFWTRGAGEPDMCTDRMASRFVGCSYGLCIRSVFRNSAEQQDHLKMKSALAAHVSRRPWKECSRKRICNSRSPSGRFAFFLTHAHYSYIFVLSYFFHQKCTIVLLVGMKH